MLLHIVFPDGTSTSIAVLVVVIVVVVVEREFVSCGRRQPPWYSFLVWGLTDGGGELW